MKKSLYILLAIALCLLMFCAACGKDTTANNNNADNPPDIGGDVTPDNTPVTDKDTTPPDDSADEDNYPTKTVTPYTIELPQYPDELTKLNNRQALDAYSDYLQSSGDTTAFDLKKQTEMKLSILNGYVGATYFQLVDFGYDGRLELVLCSDHSSNSYGIVFYEDGRLYVARVDPRNMMYLKYNGLCRSIDDSGGESYVMYNFSANDGVIIQTLATLRKDADSGEESYFVSADFIDGSFEETETFKVSKEDYETFIKPIKGLTSVSKKTRTTQNMNDAFTVKVKAIPNPVINRDLAFAKKEPTDDEKQANRDALRLYSRFLSDTWYAIELETGEKGSFYELEYLNNSYIDYTALVDFGLDGIFEMVVVPTSIEKPVSVVFYEDGEIYITYFDCNELQLLTYDGLCKNSSGGVDRLTFSAQDGCTRQSVISVATDSANKTTYYSHADSREITQAEYDGFMTEQTFPVFYADKSKYSMISVPSEYSLPTDDVIEANHDVLQAYYDFINGACVALNRSAGEYVTFDAVTRYGTNKARNFGLVDFGSDGVLEMVLNDTGYHYYTVLYYMDGQLYEDGYSYRTFSWPTYTGIAVGSGGSSGSKFMVTYTEQGRQEWTFMYYGLDREIYEDRYYISAAYEDGKLVPAETVEVDKYTYYSFLENEPSVQGHTFDDETLKKVLKVDGVTAAPGHSDGGDTGFDAAEQNAQAIQAYYQWLTGGREAVDTSNPNVRRTRTDMAEFSVRYGRFGFADFGSDGVVELVLEYATSPFNHTVLYYDDGELYIGSLYCDNLKENGYYEEETNWGGVRLLHHYVKRFAPSKGEYTIELGYETPPSKDSPNPVYRLYYTVVDGEYVLYTGESSKDALYSVLKEQFDTPDVKWLSFDTVFEHEFFAGVTGNN